MRRSTGTQKPEKCCDPNPCRQGSALRPEHEIDDYLIACRSRGVRPATIRDSYGYSLRASCCRGASPRESPPLLPSTSAPSSGSPPSCASARPGKASCSVPRPPGRTSRPRTSLTVVRLGARRYGAEDQAPPTRGQESLHAGPRHDPRPRAGRNLGARRRDGAAPGRHGHPSGRAGEHHRGRPPTLWPATFRPGARQDRRARRSGHGEPFARLKALARGDDVRCS